MSIDQHQWLRPVEIILGALSITVALVVFLSPPHTMRTIVSLLSFSLFFYSARLVFEWIRTSLPLSLRGAGLVGGLAIGAIAIINVSFTAELHFAILVLLFASALAVNGAIRLVRTLDFHSPKWFRVSALTVGSTTLVISGLVFAFPDIARISLVGMLVIAIVINGAESIVSGVRPSSPKQIALIKLIAFAVFYGLFIINWIDLYGSGAPGYHVWLILAYLAPFDVLLVFQGLKDWQLALSLGLLVSLVNDLDYYITGDLFFGFHVNLVPWLLGQLGFEGSKVLFYFQGGFFTIPVTSYIMGITVYARMAFVVLILYQWWKRPWKLHIQ
ncbi:MAG: hypothetical protein JRN15_00300 [Nitrososphaerota archaeon]|nr:hypothetical protein [Nitrososphaerota archaeon]